MYTNMEILNDTQPLIFDTWLTHVTPYKEIQHSEKYYVCGFFVMIACLGGILLVANPGI